MKTIRKVKEFFGISAQSWNAVVIKMHGKSTGLFDVIVFPHVDLSDPMLETLFKTAVKKMHDSMTGARSQISICPIDDIIDLAGLTLYGKAAEAYAWLRKLHCVKFADMHPEIAQQVPYRINMVFAGGDYSYPWEGIE